MKKKLIYVMLVACCTLSLCACFKSDAEQVAEELGMDVEDAEELSEYINGDRYEPVEEEVVEEIAATDEIISAERYTNKVQIGSTVYTFPLTVSDLLASGELTLEPARANESTTMNTLVAPGEGQSFKLVGPGVKLIMSAGNSTDAMIELKDCVVNTPDIQGDTNIVFSGGLRVGMTLDELTQLYGEPDYFDVKENQYFYCEDMYENHAGYIDSLTGYYYRISINMDTGCVSGITYSIGDEKCRNEEYVEHILAGDGYEVHCSVPEDLMPCDNVAGSRMLNADEKAYILSMNTRTYLHTLGSGYTAESVSNIFGDKTLYCAAKEDGSIVAITQEDGYYAGHYFMGEYAVEFKLKLRSAFPDDKDPVAESVVQEAYNILLEILDKEITVQ